VQAESYNGVLAVFDFVQDEGLQREGFARELISRVQVRASFLRLLKHKPFDVMKAKMCICVQPPARGLRKGAHL
jgi:hypothetical protein